VASYQAGRRQRYLCRICRRRFSQNFFSLSYRLKKNDPALNQKIFSLCVHGLSNRAIGRLSFVSPHCVRLRLERMARRALEFQAQLLNGICLSEAICVDGLENFAGSQYDPNNINQAIGRDSLFIYDFNFACLNRKGRTSPWQKQRLSQIEKVHGRYDSRAIRHSFKELVTRLLARIDQTTGRLGLLTDEHFQYRRALSEFPRSVRLDHCTISSKACRNFQNILFSVNHADLMIRQQIAAFTRETISFSKTPGAMCQKYALYMVHKNFMAPQFTKTHVRRPNAHVESPAQAVKLTDKILGFPDIFSARSLQAESDLNPDWKCFWHGRVPEPYHRHPKHRRERAPSI